MRHNGDYKMVPVNILYPEPELHRIDELVDRDKSTRAAVVRKATEMLYIITFNKPELYSKIFEKKPESSVQRTENRQEF